MMNTSEKGSPPRVREKRLGKEIGKVPERITPACAGKTHSLLPHTISDQDHPRVCGKNSLHN